MSGLGETFVWSGREKAALDIVGKATEACKSLDIPDERIVEGLKKFFMLSDEDARRVIKEGIKFNSDTEKESSDEPPKIEHGPAKICGMLNAVFFEPDKIKYYIPETSPDYEELVKASRELFELGQRIEKKSISESLEKIIPIAVDMFKSMDISSDKILDCLKRFFGLSDKEAQQYLN